MKWLNLETLFRALLLVPITVIDTSEESTFTCETKECCPNWCYIFTVSIETEADIENAAFPNETAIVIANSKIQEFSSKLMDKLVSVKKFQIDGGTIESIYVKPTLSSFWAQKNNVQKVVIDDTDNHQLTFLEVTFNKLQSIPANINRLKHLEHLYLNNNEIMEVNLNILHSLTKLEYLNLNSNRILRVDTTVNLKLPTLFEISLYENQLDTLHISLWDFSKFKKLPLGHNKLRSVKGLATKFPTLKHITLYENRWNCGWLQETLRELFARNVTIRHEENCSGRSNVSELCCDDSEEYLSISNEIKKANDRLNQEQQRIDTVDLNIQQLRDELRVLSTSIQEELKWVKQKLNQNRAAIDDVVEDLYLSELEEPE